MKNSFTLFVILLLSLKTYAQPDSSKIIKSIYNGVYKNISAYYIHLHSKSESSIDKRGFLADRNWEHLFDRVLPDEGYKLEMMIQKLDEYYPKKGYTLYEVRLNGLRFKSISGNFYEKSQYKPVTDQVDPVPGEYYLVALGKNMDLRFISGAFFVQDISVDFVFDPKEPTSYLNYLKYKTFDIQTSDIAFVKRKGGKMFFSAYSKLYEKKVLISIVVKRPWDFGLSAY